MSEELLNEAESKMKNMEDNTEFVDKDKNFRFAKLKIPAVTVDFITEHFGFFDIVETNIMAIHVMYMLAQMEKDGYLFSIFKPTKDETGKVVGASEMFGLDIHELIANLRVKMAGELNKSKEKEKTNESGNDKV